MNRAEVTVNGEKAGFEIKVNQVCLQGYDMESERIALTLGANKGSGIGVLLVALNEVWLGENLSEILSAFPLLPPHTERGPKETRLLQTYQTFSPDNDTRTISLMAGDFSERTWNRLLDKSDSPTLAILASNPHLPLYVALEIARHPDLNVRMALAMSRKIPQFRELHEVLVNDEVREVGDALLRNKKCNNEIAKIEFLKPDTARREILSLRMTSGRVDEDLAEFLVENGSDEEVNFWARTNPGGKGIKALIKKSRECAQIIAHRKDVEGVARTMAKKYLENNPHKYKWIEYEL